MLRSATLEALSAPPCFVSFSGGRDSSAVLAAAVECARREGLPLPVPLSARFPDAPGSYEAQWQERVIGHLGLEDWVRIDVAAGDMDIVGPLAQEVLRRHGLVFPANMVFVQATLRAASGGWLLTGMGGDDLFVEWRWRELADALTGRRRLNRWDLLDAAYQFLPRSARSRLDRRYLEPPPLWLRTEARLGVVAALAAERLDEPLSWPGWLRWCVGRIHLRAVRAAFDQLGHEAGTRVGHPLLDPAFIAALGASAGATGIGDRTTIMLDAFREALPADVCTRPGKASFNEIYWTHHARDFVADWDGSGVDDELVDRDVLRREWSQPLPDTRSWLLLQSAWLASRDLTPYGPDSGPGVEEGSRR